MENKSIKCEIDEFGFAYIYCNIFTERTTVKTLCKCIIDTGAHYSLIKPHLIDRVQSKNFGKNLISNPLTNDIIKTYKYKVCLNINGFIIKDVIFTDLKQQKYPSDIVLGMDIIKNTQFFYDGENKTSFIKFFSQ